MNELQQLFFCRVLLDSNRDESSIWKALDAVYANGYVDRHESPLLKAIAQTDLTQTPHSAKTHVDTYTKTTVENLLTQKVFYAESYHLFRQNQAPQMASGPIGSNVSLDLEELQSTANGGFQLTLTLRDGDFVKKLEIALPDAEGKYPNGAQAGFENVLDEKITGLLIEHALNATYDNPSNQFDPILLQRAYDAVARVGQKNQSEVKKQHETPINLDNAGFTTGNGYSAETNFSDEIGRRATALATHKKDIYGIKFIMPASNDLDGSIENVLAAYPEYVLQAWARTNFTVILFDSSQIHPELFKEGIFKSPREAMMGWSDAKEKKIFLAREFLYELPHELSHALNNTAPPYSWPLLQHPVGNVGISKTYREAKSRIIYYPEEVFAAEYEDANLSEQLAELPVIYYGQHGVSATSDELKSEEPMAYVCLEMIDEILKQYDFSRNDTDTPPVWLAYTETARFFAQSYLIKYGASWNEEANLKEFRHECMQLDFTPEIDFWKAHDQFREFFEEETIPDYGLSKSRYLEAAEQMRSISPDNEFFKRKATLARLHKDIHIGQEISVRVQTEQVENIVARVVESTDGGIIVAFSLSGKEWQFEIFCTSEFINLYHGEDSLQGVLTVNTEVPPN